MNTIKWAKRQARNLREWLNRQPVWARVFVCLAVVLLAIGFLTAPLSDSPIGSFVANVIAEVIGISAGAVATYFVVTRYVDRARLSRLERVRKPYVNNIKNSLNVSLGALCQGLQCPCADEAALKGPRPIRGKEKEVRQWFMEVENGNTRPNVKNGLIMASLAHILTFGLESPARQLWAVSHLFEGEEHIISEFFTIYHNVHGSVDYIRGFAPDMNTNPEALKMLGTCGRQIVDLLAYIPSAESHGVDAEAELNQGEGSDVPSSKRS